MVTVECLGSGREVGRSAISVVSGNDKFILDYGLDVQDMSVPMNPGRDIKGVFLSHAHLDHSGHAPNLYRQGYANSIYATPTTFGLTSLLLRDSIKVQERKGIQPLFMLPDLKKMERMKKILDIGRSVKLGGTTISFFDAGHVPGSCMTLIEIDGKRILYTGDVKFIDTYLMKAGHTDFRDIDVLITESTYSYKNHPDRGMLADKLREIAQHTVYNNGTLLLPAFAVGRTQELLIMLYDLGFEIYLDGMGIAASRIIMGFPKSVRSPKKLEKAFGTARKIRNQRQRENAVKKPCIIITTSGMLNGGPVGFYVPQLHKREDCTMVMSGYQVEGTVGRKLLDTGRYVNEGLDLKLKMKTEFMDLSAHCGRDGIINFIKKTKPKKTVLVHGDRTVEFAKELKGMGFDAVAPKNGDKIAV